MSDLIQKIAVIPALDQKGHQVAPGELITFDPSLSRDPEAFVKALNKSKAFRDPGKGRVRNPVEEGAPIYTATPPVPSAVEEEGRTPTSSFNAEAVIDGNVPTAANRIAEIDNEADLDAVLAAEKAKGNRTGIMEAIELRRAAILAKDD